MYNEAYFLFACVQKRICDFMCAWMRYARVRKTEKPRVPHVQGLVENRNSGMRSTPRHHPIERPIALHSLPARPMRPDSHASLNLKPAHWLKPTYYTCNKGLWQISHNYGFLGRSLQWRLGTSRICTAVACPDTGLCRAKPGAGTAMTGIAPDTRESLCATPQFFGWLSIAKVLHW